MSALKQNNEEPIRFMNVEELVAIERMWKHVGIMIKTYLKRLNCEVKNEQKNEQKTA